MKKHYKGWLKSLGVWEDVKMCVTGDIKNYSDIIDCFYWRATFQGYDYWNDIYIKIQSFKSLIKRVEKIDPEAARWLKKEAYKLNSFDVGDDLTDCFCWDRSPQGYNYWFLINKKLTSRQED